MPSAPRPRIGIVGTRTPSREGFRIAFEVARQLAGRPDPLLGLAVARPIGMRLATLLVGGPPAVEQAGAGVGARAIRLAESIADVEYAIKSHEALKGRASRWLKLHLLTSIVFYLLLTLHVWAATYFGLRWLP